MARRELAIGDTVGFTETAGQAPAGARGAITDVLDSDEAIVELTAFPPEPILDRIVVAPIASLRPVEPATT